MHTVVPTPTTPGELGSEFDESVLGGPAWQSSMKGPRHKSRERMCLQTSFGDRQRGSAMEGVSEN